ncbi:MAG: hypothetical protein PHU57_02290 [Patescibacteria group bacterium]|nr:hypothetical protein [Patescibacteria group bacterium]
MIGRLCDTAWGKRHQGLIDFFLLILYVIGLILLSILRAVKGFFVFLGFCLAMFFLLTIAAGLWIVAIFIDPKSKLRRGIAKYSKLAVEFLKLGRDAFKAFGVLALAALLIGIVVATDPKHAFSTGSEAKKKMEKMDSISTLGVCIIFLAVIFGIMGLFLTALAAVVLGIVFFILFFAKEKLAYRKIK